MQCDIITMKHVVLLLMICVAAVCAAQSEMCETLYLLNLVPYPDNRTFAGWDRGFELIPAGHLAAKHINSNPDILPGYRLEVINVRSEACGLNIIVDGVTQYHKHLFSSESVNPMCVLGIVGLYCSTVTNTIAPIANNRNLGYVQLAASTSPLHRNTTAFNHTFHAIASSRIFNQAMVAMMKRFKWKKVNVVYGSVGFYFRSTALDFLELLNSSSEILQFVTEIPVDSSISELFQMISEKEVRIGYFTVTNEETAEILCIAYQRNFLSRYLFIFHERTVSEVLSGQENTNCTEEELIEAMRSIFLLQYKLESPMDSELLSNISYGEYYDQYLEELLKFSAETNMSLEVNNTYANVLYDQVWAFALAANKSLGRANFSNALITPTTVNEILNNRNILAESLLGVKFDGASGFISFETEQEVQTSVNIFRVLNGTQQLIGTYNPYTDNLTFTPDFDQTTVPGDSFETRHALLPQWLGSLVILGCVFLILLTLFNTIAMLVLRKTPEIKSTSLYLSLVILVGCFLLLLSPVLLTIQLMFHFRSTNTSIALCSLEFWSFVDGMIFIFLTLLLRLFRVFYVFRSHHSTSKYWSDKYLILYIILMFSFMMFMLLIQSVADPFQVEMRRTFVMTTSTTNLPYILTYMYCSSSSTGTWLALSSIFVAVVMVFVIFLAIMTRRIKKKHFKDTKKVNMFIFSVCLTYAIFIPLWLILLPVSDTGAYVCKCIASLMAAALCQAFLFLPKVIPATYISLKHSV